MAEWTKDDQGFHVFTAEDGAQQMRILPPADGLRTPRWTTETRNSRGAWDRDYMTCDSLEDARSDVEDRYRHVVELRTLPRREDFMMREQKRTPWGIADSKVEYGEGVTLYGTPGHGGFHLDRKRNAKVHPALRKACGDGPWYEEDASWAAVAYSFPELFTSRERRLATEALKRWYPHAYMAATGEKVELSESHVLRQEEHARKHANDWHAIAASSDDDNPGMTRVIATVGGRRSDWNTTVEEKTFLVPSSEYTVGELSFVIDPDRHQEVKSASEHTPAP